MGTPGTQPELEKESLISSLPIQVPVRPFFARLILVATLVSAGLCIPVAYSSTLPSVACTQFTPIDFDETEQLFFSGKYSECFAQASSAISEEQDDETWFLLAIDSLMAQGEYRTARQFLEQGLDTNPNSIRLRMAGYQVWRCNNNIQRARELLTELAELVQYRQWRYRDAGNQVTHGRFRLHRKTDAKEVLSKYYTPAALKSPNNAVSFLAIGDLGLEKHDYALAAENYQTAVELEPANPAGYLGLAIAWRSSDYEKSNAAIQKATELNPDYPPALHYLIDDRINSERYDDAVEFAERALKVNPRDAKAWSYRAVIAHLQNDPDGEAQARKEAFAVYERAPEVDHLIGKKLSQRYRFKEGARMQRRALTYSPDFLPAKIQLANDLLRLGDAEEGWKLADEVYRDDGYNVVAYNLVTLGRKVSGYTALQRDGFIVRMEPDEANIYGDMVLDLLVEAKRELVEKYDTTLAEPIFVEIFPQQEDFAIRTFGLPGGAGYLGVCFGRVITMNSPKSQSRLGSNWKAVLWHEFCHVVTLQKTKNRMPRWLSEGISVYEERIKDQSWGQVMNPAWRDLILADGLTPVSKLSEAFIKPESGEALQFAYFESSLVVEYIVETYGLDVLRNILDDLRIGMPINQVLGRYTGDVKLLDQEFAEFARKQAMDLGSGLNWDKPGLTALSSLEDWQQWNVDHSDNYYGMKFEAAKLIEAKEYDKATTILNRLNELYPNDRAGDNAWAMLAMIARKKGEQAVEIEMLEKSASLQSASADVYQRLAELAADNQDWRQAALNAERWLAVNPLIPEPHRVVAKALGKQGEFAKARNSLKAITMMDPFDPAEAFFQYALALEENGEGDLAIRQVLKCLEQAPRYRKAQQMLLRLVDEREQNESTGSIENPRSETNADEAKEDE